MDPEKRSKWIPRLAALTVAGLLLAAAAWSWDYSNVLRDELVRIESVSPARDVEVVAVGSGRITVARTDVTELEGIWGVIGPNGYGQASVVIAMTDETVERAFRGLSGEFDAGELVVFDPVAYPGDPFEAHRIDFEEVRFTGDLGVYPAWVIDGDRDIWVILLHGAGPDQRQETLRMLPALAAERYPVMVMTVRGDEGAPLPRSGLRSLGATEWRDLAAAVAYGKARNADQFVLFGIDTGASTVANYLNQEGDISAVKGVVYDSALFDPETVADRIAAERDLPGLLRDAGKLLASIRFDIDWDELDQLDLAEEYTVPVLVLHGADDDVTRVETARRFAELLGENARYVEFASGRHAQLWNSDPARYEDALVNFVESVREQ